MSSLQMQKRYLAFSILSLFIFFLFSGCKEDPNTYRYPGNLTILNNPAGEGKALYSPGNGSGNTLLLRSGAPINAFIFGGVSLQEGAVVQKNTIIVNGAQSGHIYGGNSIAGVARDNAVFIKTGNVNGITGGYGLRGSSGNRIVVEDASSMNIPTTIGPRIIGGESSGSANGNSITIESDYDVLKEEGHPIGGDIVGGYSKEGDSSNNEVILKNAWVEYVTGGEAEKGNASNNSVTLLDSRIMATARAAKGNESSSGNTLLIKGGKVDRVDGGGRYQGNIIILRDSPEIGDISNADEVRLENYRGPLWTISNVNTVRLDKMTRVRGTTAISSNVGEKITEDISKNTSDGDMLAERLNLAFAGLTNMNFSGVKQLINDGEIEVTAPANSSPDNLGLFTFNFDQADYSGQGRFDVTVGEKNMGKIILKGSISAPVRLTLKSKGKLTPFKDRAFMLTGLRLGHDLSPQDSVILNNATTGDLLFSLRYEDFEKEKVRVWYLSGQ